MLSCDYMAPEIDLLDGTNEIADTIATNGGYGESILSAAEILNLPPTIGATVISPMKNTPLFSVFVYDANNFEIVNCPPSANAQEMNGLIGKGYTVGHDGRGENPTVLVHRINAAAGNSVAA